MSDISIEESVCQLAKKGGEFLPGTVFTLKSGVALSKGARHGRTKQARSVLRADNYPGKAWCDSSQSAPDRFNASPIGTARLASTHGG